MSHPPPANTSRRTILFVDIASSTALYDDLGDAAARARVGPCLSALAGLVVSGGGQTIKSLGDGLLAAFDSESCAVTAALEMVDRALEHRLRVHIGLHCGEVLEEEGDLFGQAVNTALRICALAKPSEILISTGVFQRLPPHQQAAARRIPAVAVKGLREELELFVLECSDDTSTTLNLGATSIRSLLGSRRGLELLLEGRTWMVDSRAAFTLGRGPENDLVLDRQEVSRRHATISLRRGKMVIQDQSVNGTWILPDDGSLLHLLREESPLHGRGQLFLGLGPDRPGAQGIAYRAN